MAELPQVLTYISWFPSLAGKCLKPQQPCQILPQNHLLPVRWQAGLRHFFQIAAGGQQGIIAAEDDFFRAHHLRHHAVNHRPVDKRGGGGIEVDVSEGLGGLLFQEPVERQPPAPVGQDPGGFRKGLEDLVEGRQGRQRPARVFRPGPVGGMDQQGRPIMLSELGHRGQQVLQVPAAILQIEG